MTVRVALLDMTRRLEQELGDNLVRLFGSYARGEARPDSDVAVLVLVKESTPDLRWQVNAIAADVGLDHDLVIATLTAHGSPNRRLMLYWWQPAPNGPGSSRTSSAR